MPDYDVETTVDQAEASEMIYSDEQKYNYLFNKYPILKELKRSLNLDLS
jgi:hypothetical protein